MLVCNNLFYLIQVSIELNCLIFCQYRRGSILSLKKGWAWQRSRFAVILKRVGRTALEDLQRRIWLILQNNRRRPISAKMAKKWRNLGDQKIIQTPCQNFKSRQWKWMREWWRSIPCKAFSSWSTNEQKNVRASTTSLNIPKHWGTCKFNL